MRNTVAEALRLDMRAQRGELTEELALALDELHTAADRATSGSYGAATQKIISVQAALTRAMRAAARLESLAAAYALVEGGSADVARGG